MKKEIKAASRDGVQFLSLGGIFLCCALPPIWHSFVEEQQRVRQSKGTTVATSINHRQC